MLFCDYYKQWISVYKEGAIRPVTMNKYNMAHNWLIKLIPDLIISDLDRITYQKLLNDYAAEHERQTTMDFHHHLKCAILDAVDEGLILHDPTRKAIIKGKPPREKKPKYLNQYELHKLLDDLNLSEEINLDWLILLIAKTGMRFSEALALTPKDFDLSRQLLSVSKTWDYKGEGGFLPTKNESSVRKIPLDWQTVIQFAELIKHLPEDKPIFVKKKIYNSTVNHLLARHCRNAAVPIISVHGLRHTHASLLLFAGVSIASVARRLGHSNITTTQKTYLHIIQELESKDIDIIMRSLSNLGRPYIMAIDGCIHDGWLAIRNTQKNFDLKFLCTLLGTDGMLNQYKAMAAGSTVNNLNKELVGGTTIAFPIMEEQIKIGEYFSNIDHLITLHQRKQNGRNLK